MSSADMPGGSRKSFKKGRVLNIRGFIFVFASVVPVCGSKRVQAALESKKGGMDSNAISLRFKKRGEVLVSKGGSV